ncbi:MAG TPA: ABC transporter ATP-binding protein [Novosphingobium sp.]|nr:ABC transporter ATP-binding protein [Novosphingobium sp.]
MTEPRLSVSGLSSFYGGFQALFDVSFSIAPGAVLALIGANGAGKTTLLKTLAGVLRPPARSIHHNGACLASRTPAETTRAGVAVVPEGRRLFASLSVEENLLIGAQVKRPGPWTLEAVYALFPALVQRRHHLGPQLSGGQQQMVAIGRALMANPDLLLLDELSLGLAPVVIEEIYRAFRQIVGPGVSAILVEQDINRALSVSDQFLCLRAGKVVLSGDSRTADQAAIIDAYFGVHA